MTPTAPQHRRRWPALLGGFLLLLAPLGCDTTGQTDLRRRVVRLEEQLREREQRLEAQQAAIAELEQQLTTARGISKADLDKIFYPERIVIDKLTGGADYDDKPGDDGVTVYLRPVDREGDTIKVAGDITIQLYDLAAPPNRNFIGAYRVPADEVGKLWHGKFLTDHYTIKCPWPKGPPAHEEITVRVVFVDFLTKRVVSAQDTCQVQLPRP